MKVDTRIANGTVITVNSTFDIIADGEVGIRNGKIVHVGPAGQTALEAEEAIDARGGLIMPGLINTHAHLPMSLFRGLADDLPLAEWLNDHIFPAEAAHVSPETVAVGTMLSCAEMLLSGTTTVCDGYFFEDAVAEAVVAAGIRAVVGQGVIDFPAPGAPDPERNVEVASAFVFKWQNRCDRIIPSIFCHSPYTCSAATLQAAKRAALEAGVPFQIHVAETQGEANLIGIEGDTTPVKHLDELGVLDEQTVVAHAVWVNAVDMSILHDRGVGISHNPESNMKLASGIAPVPAMIAAGINVGLGTDGCASNNNLDMFDAMGMAAKLHKAAMLDPTVMSADTVLKMATIEGACVLGLDRVTGSIETGKAADLIVIDTRKPHLTPMYHPESHLVYAARGSDVRHVMVDGNLLVRDGRLVHMDVDEIMARAVEVGNAIRRTDERKA